MPLNPVEFGTNVVNQFGRYLKTTYPIADPRLAEQVDDALRHQVDAEPLLYRGPYVTLHRAFMPGPTIQQMIEDLGLHPALKGLFDYPRLHKHQEETLRQVANDKHVILSTGTGSGKTESFLLPIYDHCLHMRDQNAPNGVVAILVYPMNALVNDQLARLRSALAGTRITFGRYTGETPHRVDDDLLRLAQPRAYTAQELHSHSEQNQPLPYPWEEAVSRQEIRDRQPRILLTNYAQLEYLLLQDRDLDLFRGAPLRFLVFDEVHTYTGELGSEVACLIRRLREVARKQVDDVTCIGTSATVSDTDSDLNGEEATRQFAHRLFGVPAEDIEFIAESYRPFEDPVDIYMPPPPEEPLDLFDEVLDAAASVHRQDEPGPLPEKLLDLTEELCGHHATTGQSINDRIYDLLASNKLVRRLEHLLEAPKLLRDILQPLRQLEGRHHASDDELIAEVLALLTLGALAERNGEPLLRPKLHYFVQGYQGLHISFDGPDSLSLHFERDTGRNEATGLLFPLLLCRSCGQHYIQVIASSEEAVEVEGETVGFLPARPPEDFEKPDKNETLHYLTDSLHTFEENEEEEEREPGQRFYLCRHCGSLFHSEDHGCINEKCYSGDPLIPVWAWADELKKCAACGGQNWGQSNLITHTHSAEVADVTILVLQPHL